MQSQTLFFDSLSCCAASKIKFHPRFVYVPVSQNLKMQPSVPERAVKSHRTESVSVASCLAALAIDDEASDSSSLRVQHPSSSNPFSMLNPFSPNVNEKKAAAPSAASNPFGHASKPYAGAKPIPKIAGASFVAPGFVKTGVAVSNDAFLEADGFAPGADSEEDDSVKEQPARAAATGPNPFAVGPNPFAASTSAAAAAAGANPFSHASKPYAGAKPIPKIAGASFVAPGFVKTGVAVSNDAFLEADGFAPGADSEEDDSVKEQPARAAATGPNPFAVGPNPFAASTSAAAAAAGANPFSHASKPYAGAKPIPKIAGASFVAPGFVKTGVAVSNDAFLEADGFAPGADSEEDDIAHRP